MHGGYTVGMRLSLSDANGWETSALSPVSREHWLPRNSNHLLNALPDGEREALAPHLKPVAYKRHDILYDVRQEVNEVYFATDAVVSLVVPLSTGEVVESAMVGRDGIVGAGAALNGRVSLNRAIVQIGGRISGLPGRTAKRSSGTSS